MAIATSRRNLRIFMIGGTQREILALPGPVVAMNGLGNRLLVAYHAGIGKKLLFSCHDEKLIANCKYLFSCSAKKKVRQVIRI